MSKTLRIQKPEVITDPVDLTLYDDGSALLRIEPTVIYGEPKLPYMVALDPPATKLLRDFLTANVPAE